MMKLWVMASAARAARKTLLLWTAVISVAAGAATQAHAKESSVKGRPAPRARAPEVVPAEIGRILEEIRKPGARAVLVNVWATWCDPCIEEMPDIVRFYKNNKDRGLRLVLISGDVKGQRKNAATFLAKQGLDIPSFLKVGDDQAFIDGLDKEWSGTLPTSILFDGTGKKRRSWSGKVTFAELQKTFDEALKSEDEPRRKP